jgi:WD40 repeat protein
MSVRKILFLAVICLVLASTVSVLCSQPATFPGHTSDDSWKLSPDGQTLVWMSKANGMLKLWDVASGRPRATLPESIVRVGRKAVGTNGKIVACQDNSETLQLWDAFAIPACASIEGVPPSTRCVTISPDGRTVAGVIDKVVTLWDVASGNERATLKGHTNTILSLAFSPDNMTLASGGWYDAVRLWDVDYRQFPGNLREGNVCKPLPGLQPRWQDRGGG